jgi:Peptidase family M23/Putative serine esterase (DUF676)
MPAAAVGAPPPPGSWTLPVAGPVARGFAAPASRYGAGHRGVDFAVAAGTPVRAAGNGVVTFAGQVAGGLHVVVAHGGDLRTSYSFLASATVRRGDTVERGDVLGTAGGPSGEHPPGLHLGLRLGDEYIDPMLLFRPTDLSRVVHLAPVTRSGSSTGGSWAVEALGVRRGLDLPNPPVVDGTGAPAEHGAVGDWLRDAAGVARTLTRRVPGVADAEAAIDRLAAMGRTRLDCTAAPSAADGSSGSGHLLMAVGGINSSTDTGTGATFGLPPETLGYRAGEVHWYSYSPDGGAYDANDTHGRIHTAALRLAQQLRALHATEPGREVDLVAHSQGGVVVDEFLQHVYDAADAGFPPLGTVVTLSSPHHGAPLATAADQIGGTDSGHDVLGAAAGLGLPANAPALTDLREGSRTMRELWRHRLPDQVDFTTIGAVDDLVVPASQTAVPGATQVLVDPKGPLDHSAVTSDGEALAAVRLALEGRPPPCPSAGLALRGALEPLVITRFEHAIGTAGRAVGQAVDAVTGILP